MIGDSRAKAIMFELAEHASTRHNRVALRGMVSGEDPRVRKVIQPLLVCAADHDRLAPRAPGARLVGRHAVICAAIPPVTLMRTCRPRATR